LVKATRFICVWSIIAHPLQKRRQAGDVLHRAGQHLARGLAGLVDDQQLVVKGGAVLGVVAAIDTDVRPDSIFLPALAPPFFERRLVGGHAVADDGHSAPARLQAFQPARLGACMAHATPPALDALQGRLAEAEALLLDPQALYNPCDELENLIELGTAEDASVELRAKLLKAVSVPTHATTMRDLAMAMRNLVMLERQAFNVTDSPEPDEPEPGSGTAMAVTEEFAELKAAFAAKVNPAGGQS
jgi:hypothetical protein